MTTLDARGAPHLGRAAIGFRAAMRDVVAGIENEKRFGLLKRFVTHGSRVPTFDTESRDSEHALSDEELASCIDFLHGQMVAKFQGKLAELLAVAPVSGLIESLKRQGRVPSTACIAFGSSVRCRRASGAEADADSATVEGPDFLVYTAGKELLRVVAIGEVKSMPRSRISLARQTSGHLLALSRGVFIRKRLFRLEPRQSPPLRFYAIPSAWKLTRDFQVVLDERGVKQIVMAGQTLPETTNTIERVGPHEWIIRLAWSWDALRAAGFNLTHRYLRFVGLAMARDPEMTMRPDMSSEAAAMNDFLHQLHIAIFRQRDSEPSSRRRQKTIELYNVLGFGWSLGHGFRDDLGKPVPMFFEDLERISDDRATRRSSSA